MFAWLHGKPVTQDASSRVFRGSITVKPKMGTAGFYDIREVTGSTAAELLDNLVDEAYALKHCAVQYFEGDETSLNQNLDIIVLYYSVNTYSDSQQGSSGPCTLNKLVREVDAIRQSELTYFQYDASETGRLFKLRGRNVTADEPDDEVFLGEQYSAVVFVAEVKAKLAEAQKK